MSTKPAAGQAQDEQDEEAFAKLKGRLRTAAARTVDDLHAAIRQTLKHFTATECRNYIEAAGYENDLAVSE